MGAVFKVEFCIENMFVRTRTTLRRKKQTIQKLRKLQELHCFAYDRFQLKFPFKVLRSEDLLTANHKKEHCVSMVNADCLSLNFLVTVISCR